MDSDKQNKYNKRFNLNYLKNRKSIRWAVLNAPKNPFIISSLVKPFKSKNLKQIRIWQRILQLTLSQYLMKHQPTPRMKSISSLWLK